MRKIIWTCWFQGRQVAPEPIRKCLQSWEERNPGWDFRCLDASTISHYIDLSPYIDLTKQRITPASLSDIVRLLLLHEYGGAWVDATTFCNAPLDDWLPLAANTGFFAYSHRGLYYPFESWFLAAEPGNSLLAKLTARVLRYWQGRPGTNEYFWLYRLFGELCANDEQAFRAWQAIPRISAFERPHAIQIVGMYEDFDAVKSKIDWTIPVFKLTHRLDTSRITPHCVLARLLNLSESNMPPVQTERPEPSPPATPVGLLRPDTDDLGEHLQMIAAENLLRRAGLVPSFAVDRDEEIARPPPVPTPPAGIVLNSGFYNWPPHSAYRPIYLGFHVPLHQAANLTSPVALKHYAAHGPVGCRDRSTFSLLCSHGVQAFLSHCLTLTFARRPPNPDVQTEVFVVSRTRQILDYLPASIGPYRFVSQYSASNDPVENKHQAMELLRTYRDCAKLVITTMLHCALPVIAMGIPVVVFYPPDESEREVDVARFSSLSELVRIFRVSEAALVDWQGYNPDVSLLKLKLLDHFFAMAARWNGPTSSPIGPVAPPSILLPSDTHHDYFEDPERYAELVRTKSPDRERWSAICNYVNPEWAHRSSVAAQFIRDGSRVLEVGTGLGDLRRLIADRCNYTGADLEPFDENTRELNLDTDPIPDGPWDTVVLLGVLEYLYYPMEALAKLANAAPQLLISYPCHVDEASENVDERRRRGWTNSMTERKIMDELETLGFRPLGRQLLTSTPHFREMLFHFTNDFT